jgi:hypothetical protein
MRRGLLLTAMVVALFGVRADATAAGCHLETVTHTLNGFIYVGTVKVCPGTSTTSTSSAVDLPPTDSGLDSICVATAITGGLDPFAFCGIPPDEAPELTPGMVAAALTRVPLPAAALKVQPANGRTLVNFDTNFYTEIQPLDRTITLLGQQVDLHIVPSQFGWRFGDGESLATDQPGAPYPHLDVTHNYLTKGAVAPSVDTTYTAQFRVNGGPWRDVPGSVTIPGAPVDLQVLTATPTLVGYGRG